MRHRVSEENYGAVLNLSRLGTTSNAEINTTQDPPLRLACVRWSNRILILSLVGIAYLTLFPFEIRMASPHAFHDSPLLLGDSAKTLRHTDFFLNVLLFVPFGFGLSAQLSKRGSSRVVSFLSALAGGACVSYAVELLQLYIPGRDSGWEDVVSNTLGSIAGFFLLEYFGGVILKEASRFADSFEGWMSTRRMALLLAIYFTCCFGISALLQRQSRLSNWNPQASLAVGNDAAGQNPWRGQVFLLQIWNRALPEQAIQGITKQDPEKDPTAGLLGSYGFKGAPPYRDQTNSLPDLGWAPAAPGLKDDPVFELDAKSWLRSKIPVENLTREIKKTSQFTVHVVCRPAATLDATGRIVSFSVSAEDANFHLRQEGTSLVVWIRNPMSETRSMLAWRVRDVFEPGKARDIVAIYDGADAFVYLDGIRVSRIYRLSPGAGIMRRILSIRTADLNGAVVVYETLVFLPAGLLIGLEAGKPAASRFSTVWMLTLGLLLPAALLELLLVEVSGRGVWPGNIALSIAVGLAGVLLMNADGRHLRNFHR